MPTVNLTANKVSTANLNKPTSNYAGSTHYYYCVGYANWSAGAPAEIDNLDYCRGWVGFDLSSIPTNATIISANFSTWIFGAGSDGNYADIPFHVKYCSDNSWTEAGINWNNSPDGSVSGTDTINTTILPNGVKKEFVGDVSSAVILALSSRALSLRIECDILSPGYGMNLLTESSSTPSPTISITYTVPSLGAGALFFGSD